MFSFSEYSHSAKVRQLLETDKNIAEVKVLLIREESEENLIRAPKIEVLGAAGAVMGA